MAETKTKAVKAAPKSAAAAKAPAEEVPQVLEAPEKEAPKQAYKVRKQLDPHTIVTVKNGFPGMLIYESSKTGEMFRWESLGDEQDMELQELKNARNASKAFYVNNWFRIDDPEILDYLGVAEYYKNALNLIDDETLRALKPEDIRSTVMKMSDGQKLALKYRVKQMIENGDIDSMKMITAFEEALGVELIER
jgi:hypothetical protein|nr:MAG TPA: hypothetical protein [Caudoviricetes sp.]